MPMDGGLTYTVVPGWEQLPAGYVHRDVAGVRVDSQDRVYVLTRSDARLIVYTADGEFVKSWGEGLFTRPHGLAVGSDGSVYIVDDRDHTVRKFTPDGRLLMTLGTPGVPSDTGYDPSKGSTYEKTATINHGGSPFNNPTNIAVAPDGDLYVSDGYGNARVHRFSAQGQLIQSWGEPGIGHGQFHLPHGICVTADGRVLVGDRENDRVQIFTLTGRWLGEWTDLQRPTDVFVDSAGFVCVSELCRWPGATSFTRGPVTTHLPGRVSVLDANGSVVARWGGGDRATPGCLFAPHAVCVDSRGDLYVGEVVASVSKASGSAVSEGYTLQKFTRARSSR